MNITRLSLLALTCTAATAGATVESQRGALVIKGPAISVEYQVLAISPNGLWACGNVNDGTGRGWRWDLTTGVIEVLSPAGVYSIASGIADDGTVAGIFMDGEALGVHNGSETQGPGYYRDGAWHHLDVPDGYLDTTGDIGAAWKISANGRYVAGLANIKGEWLPISWDLQEGTCNISYTTTARSGIHEGCLYDITGDGQYACGFTLDDVHYNRTPAIWHNGKLTRIDQNIVGPWAAAGGFSPDGTKVLVYTGVYDIASGKLTDSGVADRYWSYEFHGIGNDGNLVGEVADIDPETLEATTGWAVYYKDGQFLDMKEYLTAQGVDLTGYGIYQAQGMSADQKTFIINTYIDNAGADNDGYVVPMAIRLDQEIALRPAVNVKARQLEGTQAVALSWDAPLANAANVTSYDVCRNGSRIATVTADERHYVDATAEAGDNAYSIVVRYGDDATPGEESALTNINVGTLQPAAPRNLAVMQVGTRQRVHMIWDAPLANAAALRYHQPEDEIVGFGGGATKFEVANRFRADELACYGTEQISAVTFVPNSVTGVFTLHLYSYTASADGNGVMTPLYSQDIDNSELYAEQENTITLTTPQAVPAGCDILAAIEIDPGEDASYNLMGMDYNRHETGYSDLIRIIGEEDFYSINEAALASATGSYEYKLTWPIMLHLSAEGRELTPDHYCVSIDGSEVASTNGNICNSDALTLGTHQASVQAVYADGTTSEALTAAIDITATDYSKVSGIDSIDVDITAPTADNAKWQAAMSWQAPTYADQRQVSYASDVCTGGVADETDYAYQAAAQYPGRLFHAYDKEYNITALRFYPTGDCDFTLYLNRDSEELACIELSYQNGYVKDQWNTIALPVPVRVDARHSYSMVVDMYDIEPSEYPLGLDSQPAVTSYGDLYSDDYGESWKSLYANGGNNANWMMGLVLEAADSEALDVKGYTLQIDKTSYSLSADHYTHNFSTAGTHTIQVDTRLNDGTVIAGSKLSITIDDAHAAIEAIRTDSADDAPRYDLWGRHADTEQGAFSISHRTITLTR